MFSRGLFMCSLRFFAFIFFSFLVRGRRTLYGRSCTPCLRQLSSPLLCFWLPLFSRLRELNSSWCLLFPTLSLRVLFQPLFFLPVLLGLSKLFWLVRGAFTIIPFFMVWGEQFQIWQRGCSTGLKGRIFKVFIV